MIIFNIKCYFRANLKIDVTKNRIFWSISQVKLKSEIHSPGNFLLPEYIFLGTVHTLLFYPITVLSLFQLIEMLVRIANFFEFE